MDSLENQVHTDRRATDIFINLVFGLQAHLQDHQNVPDALRRAMNALAFVMREDYPKTLHAFLARCSQPLSLWDALIVPDNFNAHQPLIYDGGLSEEAQEFCLQVAETAGFDFAAYGDVPQTVLDNRMMAELRQKLLERPDREAAQHLYVGVRSFLIEHAYTSRDQLMALSREVRLELRGFYDELPPLPHTELKVCERCGLLEWRNERWQGVKPDYCSDHGTGSPYVTLIPNTRELQRLNRGTHLRTFIPGRLERRLFEFAEAAHDEQAEHLISVERYPGLDAYDLRLTFSNRDVWAIDAKDHANAKRLLTHAAKPPYGEGDLHYSHAFYVVPDKRLSDPNYREIVEAGSNALPSNLKIISASDFEARLMAQLKRLATPTRRKKTKEGQRNV